MSDIAEVDDDNRSAHGAEEGSKKTMTGQGENAGRNSSYGRRELESEPTNDYPEPAASLEDQQSIHSSSAVGQAPRVNENAAGASPPLYAGDGGDGVDGGDGGHGGGVHYDI